MDIIIPVFLLQCPVLIHEDRIIVDIDESVLLAVCLYKFIEMSDARYYRIFFIPGIIQPAYPACRRRGAYHHLYSPGSCLFSHCPDVFEDFLLCRDIRLIVIIGHIVDTSHNMYDLRIIGYGLGEEPGDKIRGRSSIRTECDAVMVREECRNIAVPRPRNGVSDKYTGRT